MLDEHVFIQRVEQANVQDLVQLLARPTPDEERVLRTYFGDGRYRRLHALALRQRIRKAIAVPEGNVVVLHGIMGGELTAYKSGMGDQIWARALALIQGKVTRLQLAQDGRTDLERGTQVEATGILKSSYAEILITLADRWNVRGFWYDWRKDISLAAAELATKIDGWFGPNAPVHLVAHSMGGLVSRAFIRDHHDRWLRMWDGDSDRKGSKGGRLIMLGTPNHGSFVIPQVMTGIEGIVKKIALADLRHDLNELLPVFNSFLGSYQMLPSPYAMSGYEWLYKAESYPKVQIPQVHLDSALEFHTSLRAIIDPQRMYYVAGYNQVTFNGITNSHAVDRKESYTVTRDGDGRVPHRLGQLEGVNTFFVEESHGNLAANERVIAAIEDLLETGSTTAIPMQMPKSRGVTNSARDAMSVWAQQERELQEVRMLSRRTSRSLSADTPPRFTDDERVLRDNLLTGITPTDKTAKTTTESEDPQRTITFRLSVVAGHIQATAEFDHADIPVDAISVGHYIGVRPVFAEQQLDSAISEALFRSRSRGAGAPPVTVNGILAQFSARGTLRGELGQPFFLNDPRPSKHAGVQRLIAIAGMGYPGRFGEPELVVAARELCWSLGRMGKRHLASVLIGGGSGNMSIERAVGAWMRGIRQALLGSAQDALYHLARITFVELDPRRMLAIHDAIAAEVTKLTPGVKFEYEAPTKATLNALRRAGSRRARQDWLDEQDRRGRGERNHQSNTAPTRFTIEFNQGVYRFGAITETASIPERNIPLDPQLVMEANDDLIGIGDAQLQRERGEVMGKLLIPLDLRTELSSSAPIIVSMDAATARIHWEVIAHQALPLVPEQNNPKDAHLDAFLGCSRGLTRQLRTTFAPPPEPPPPPRRVLRVLIVADPASDAHLPGAEEEGAAIADLFRSFNTVYADRAASSSIDVITMFGPSEATRLNVLSKLMTSPVDILHFAGHCRYSTEAAKSGWIFTGDNVLSANELNRIDRIPKFVFSNACESGVMPDRPRDRNVNLAPSFAEAFFARGVANFVCTAWPVDDVAAREFALAVYSALLGLKSAEGASTRYEAAPPLPMHDAMRLARRSVAMSDYGSRTWGAYQHYGDPYLQLFDGMNTESTKSTNSSRVRPRRPDQPANSTAARDGRKRKK